VTADRQPPHHDKLTCVKHYDCKRPECLDRYRAYQRERYHGRVAGTWQPLVDAEPVRQHILALQAADFTIVRISELAGLPFETVVGFVRAYGISGYRKARKRRCTSEVAAKILAITPETARPGVVDATGTIRRIQALVAVGWPMEYLGPRVDLSARTTRALLHQTRVYGRTADAVARLFGDLKDAKPEKHGVERRIANRARAHGKRRNWAPPSYWVDRMDVIDDPHFEPMYGITRREIVAHDAGELMRVSGLDKVAAAERLGVSKSYIEHAFREHPQYAIGVAA